MPTPVAGVLRPDATEVHDGGTDPSARCSGQLYPSEICVLHSREGAAGRLVVCAVIHGAHSGVYAAVRASHLLHAVSNLHRRLHKPNCGVGPMDGCIPARAELLQRYNKKRRSILIPAQTGVLNLVLEQ